MAGGLHTLLIVPIVMVGDGFTVTSAVKVLPVQPLAVGVIVYLTTPAVVPVLVSVCVIVVPQEDEQLLNPERVPPEGAV